MAEKNKDNPITQFFLKQMESAAARGPLSNGSDASAIVQEAMQKA